MGPTRRRHDPFPKRAVRRGRRRPARGRQRAGADNPHRPAGRRVAGPRGRVVRRAAGRYERLRGVVTGEVDPDDPRHRHIVNLDRAPRNDRGRVEYRATVEIYRPVDMTRWNRAIYHTVPNRGGAGAAERALLERGFALVRVGWQGDIAPTDTNIVAELPVAAQADGSPIVGAALEEMIFDDDAPRSRYRLTYPTASREPSGGMLSVRATQTGRRQAPPDLAWNLGERHRDRGRAGPPGSTAGPSTSSSTRRRTPSCWASGSRRCATPSRSCATKRPTPPPIRTRWRRPGRPARRSRSASPRADACCATSCTRASTRTSRAASCSTACIQHRGVAEDVHQLPVRPAGALAEAARGPRLSRRPVPVHLHHH